MCWEAYVWTDDHPHLSYQTFLMHNFRNRLGIAELLTSEAVFPNQDRFGEK